LPASTQPTRQETRCGLRFEYEKPTPFNGYWWICGCVDQQGAAFGLVSGGCI
jgi:hypothetical protein